MVCGDCAGTWGGGTHASPIPLPELRRRHSLLTLEELPESRLVREAELVGNLLVGHFGGQQGVLDLAD